jgi:hypothetical protein
MDDPSTIDGSTAILDFMHQFVPIKPDGGVEVVLCSGDGLTCERHINARRHRAGSEVIPQGRLLGLEPVPGEFHKRGIYLQVRMCL